jgi:hypothetical protein
MSVGPRIKRRQVKGMVDGETSNLYLNAWDKGLTSEERVTRTVSVAGRALEDSCFMRPLLTTKS